MLQALSGAELGKVGFRNGIDIVCRIALPCLKLFESETSVLSDPQGLVSSARDD